MRSDICLYARMMYALIFQSTLPAWGATRNDAIDIRVIFISIHAPRMGSDKYLPDLLKVQVKFQSTLPAWGATAGRIS